jgi:prevent-host-death family protein
MKIAPLAEVKDQLSAYIDSSRESPIVVTRNGKPVALLTPILGDEDLDRLLLAHDPKFLGLLEAARERVRSGRSLTSEKFWKELKRRRRRKSRK